MVAFQRFLHWQEDVGTTGSPESRCSAEDTVHRYKSLAQVERAFRSLKGMDLRIHPIHHRTEDHLRVHIFLCMLAFYVEWHMRRLLAPLLFEDEELNQDRARRDPVAHAEASASAKAKKVYRVTPDGFPVHSFDTAKLTTVDFRELEKFS